MIASLKQARATLKTLSQEKSARTARSEPLQGRWVINWIIGTLLMVTLWKKNGAATPQPVAMDSQRGSPCVSP